MVVCEPFHDLDGVPAERGGFGGHHKPPRIVASRVDGPRRAHDAPVSFIGATTGHPFGASASFIPHHSLKSTGEETPEQHPPAAHDCRGANLPASKIDRRADQSKEDVRYLTVWATPLQRT